MFLNFAPMGANAENAPSSFSERRFRSYWELTDKNGNEGQRFVGVQQMIRSTTAARPRREVYLENGRVRRHPYRRSRQRCQRFASASRADTRLVCFDTKRTLSVSNHTARSVDPCYGLWGPPTLGQKWATPGTVLGGRPLGGAAKTISPFHDENRLIPAPLVMAAGRNRLAIKTCFAGSRRWPQTGFR
jgi:hypothetical protein